MFNRIYQFFFFFFSTTRFFSKILGPALASRGFWDLLGFFNFLILICYYAFSNFQVYFINIYKMIFNFKKKNLKSKVLVNKFLGEFELSCQ